MGLPLGGELVEEVGEPVFVAQLAVVNQQHGAHGGELLGERGEPEIGPAADFIAPRAGRERRIRVRKTCVRS